MNEKWEKVAGYAAFYEVSDRGRVRSLSGPRLILEGPKKGHARHYQGRVLTPQISNKGYMYVSLTRIGRKRKLASVHSLVAVAFIGFPPENHELRHKDGNKQNNASENLEYGTHQENMYDKRRHGTQTFGEHHPVAKLTEEQVLEVLKMNLNDVKGLRSKASEYGVRYETLRLILRGKSWRHLS